MDAEFWAWLARLRQQMRAIHEPEQRSGIWRSLLLESPTSPLVWAIDTLWQAALAGGHHEEVAIDAFIGAAMEPLPYERVAEIYAAAKEYGTPLAQVWLDSPRLPVPQSRRPIEQTPTLGERKTVARGASRRELSANLVDQDPAVLAQLLHNVALTLPEVVRLCAQQSHAGSFHVIAKQARWRRHIEVRRAVVENAKAPLQLATLLLLGHRRYDLAQLARAKPHAPLGALSQELLRWADLPHHRAQVSV